MESAEHSQPSAEVGPGFQETAIQATAPRAIASVNDQLLTREQQIEEILQLSEEPARLDPEYPFRRDSRQALTKASKTLLDEDERCKAFHDIVAASKQVQENALVLDEGRNLKREMRRLESLRAAWLAPRCEHSKPKGIRCGSPAVGGQKFCFFHNLARNNAVEFPVVEDRRGLQVAILRVCERLANGSISPANAKILLAGLSMAAENARNIAREDGEL